jgi:hypothetical protein
MAAKQGHKHHFARLTVTKVRKARELRSKDPKKWSYSKLGVKYGVSRNAISMAVKGQTWGHVE